MDDRLGPCGSAPDPARGSVRGIMQSPAGFAKATAFQPPPAS